MRYLSLGELPRKRHAQFRDGRGDQLLVEEVMGYEGFSGNESILYHLNSPCRIAGVGSFSPLVREEWVPPAHVHRLVDVAGVARWLASPAARFLTGQVIRINGGAVR